MKKLLICILLASILVTPHYVLAQTDNSTSTGIFDQLKTWLDKWLKQFQQIEPGGLHLKDATFPTAVLPSLTPEPTVDPSVPTLPPEVVPTRDITDPFPIQTLPPGVTPSVTPINPTVTTKPTKSPEPTLEPTDKPTSQAAKFALSIRDAGGKKCGWDAASVRSKGLVCNNCPNQPSSSKYTPVKCISSGVPSATYTRLSASAEGYTYLQCVGFARAVEEGTGGTLEGRDAKDYCTGSVPSGYQRITNVGQAKIGDLLVLTGGAWGHIIVVIDRGGSWIQVAEANWTLSGSIQTRMIDPSIVDCVLKRR